jgi:hypothetical protein
MDSTRDSKSSGSSSNVVAYDQTKLDGISQLWGLPPGEISDIPSYEEPYIPYEEDDFESISQLWGQAIQRTSTPSSSPSAAASSSSPFRASADTLDSDDFEGISQLWGEPFIDQRYGTQRVTGLPRPSSSYRTPSSLSSSSGTQRIVPDSKELRLSQILADEDWSETAASDVPQIESYEDLQKQVVSFLKAEASELLETEAILSAPPAADSVDVKEDEIRKAKLIMAPNSTGFDELAPLGMDSQQDMNDEEIAALLSTKDALLSSILQEADVSKLRLNIESSGDSLGAEGSGLSAPPARKKKKKSKDES